MNTTITSTVNDSLLITIIIPQEVNLILNVKNGNSVIIYANVETELDVEQIKWKLEISFLYK